MAVKVDKTEWEKLDSDQQQQINAIIGQNFPGETVVAGGDLDAEKVGGACTIACDVAQAAAIEACNQLPWGSGICIAAAKAAGDFCRSKC